MNRALVLSAIVFLASWSALAFGGPYSIENGHIIRIDPAYQTVTPIGNGPHNVTAIEFSQDGFIYGGNPYLNTFVRIDPVTGESETVGSLGIDVNSSIDLDEDESGQLRMLDMSDHTIYTIDRGTGAASLECQSANLYLSGLASRDGLLWTTTGHPDPPILDCGLNVFQSANYRPIVNLDWAQDGQLYGFRDVSQFQFGAFSFIRIDPSTGDEEEMGIFYYADGTGGLEGLTFDPTEQPPAPAIPALNRHGVLLLVLILIAAGVSVLLRRS